ncbi:hypothetical protein AB0L40_02820 [Patulibacter sp. NPDC049589]|uniref:hypothetical protein n=1 Tax=Patulibacter sp. NPDC049589 TaxID=3154731 RepID=UPI00342433AE
MTADSIPADPVEPDARPEVPTPDTGREVPLPNRHTGETSERPGHHDDAGTRTTPDPPKGDADEDPDTTTPPTPVADPGPDDPSVSA